MATDYKSTTSGDWGNTGTWEYLDGAIWKLVPAIGAVPGNGDDVLITHLVIIDEADVTVNSITITNTGGANARLQVDGNRTLTVTTGVIVTATVADYFTVFEVGVTPGDASMVNIDGDLIYTDNNTNNQSIRFSVDEKASVNIKGDFNYTRNANSDPVEDKDEIQIGKTLGSTATLDVTGTITLIYDAGIGDGAGAGGYLFFEADNGAMVTTGALTLIAKDAPTDGIEASDLGVILKGSSSMTVTGTTTFDYQAGPAYNEKQQIKIELNKVDTETATFTTGDVIMDSNIDNTTNNNMLRGFGMSTIDINGDVTITNVGSSDTKIYADDDATIQLSGNITYTAVVGSFALELKDNSTLQLDGNASQTLPDPKDNTLTNLILANTATLPTNTFTQTDDLTITGTLTMNGGILDPDGNTLTIADGGTFAEGSAASYIDGQVTKVGTDPISYTIPVGTGGIYAPVDIDNMLNAIDVNTSSITLEYSGTPAVTTVDPVDAAANNINHVSGAEQWIISSNDVDLTANITLHWTEGKDHSDIEDITTGVIQDLFIAGFDNTYWSNIGGDIVQIPLSNLEVGSIQLIGFGFDFSAITLMSKFGNNALPIELFDFKTENNESSIKIVWSTASEVNNDYFEIEKSTDGTHFNKIGQVEGAGNSHEMLRYYFIDFDVSAKLTYYRLRQVDFDGTSSYSSVISVENTTIVNPDDLLLVYPNPVVNNEVNIYMIPDGSKSNDFDVTILTVYDLRGATLVEKEVKGIDNQKIVVDLPASTTSNTKLLLQVSKNGHIYSKSLYIE